MNAASLGWLARRPEGRSARVALQRWTIEIRLQAVDRMLSLRISPPGRLPANTDLSR
jgi:hypothetical protein